MITSSPINLEMDRIKLATYNIFLKSKPGDIAHNIFKMQQKGVDIFCLQEVLRIKGKPFVGDEIKKILGEKWKIAYCLGSDNSYLDHGVAIIWNSHKLKKLEIDRDFLPKLPKIPFFHKAIGYLFGFNVIPSQRRIISGTFSYEDKILRVTTTHIDAAGNINQRLEHHKYLLDYLRKKTNVQYEIICGDFNTIRGRKYRDEMKQLRLVYGEEFQEISSEIPWTQDLYYCDFNSRKLKRFIKKFHIHFRQKLDHIFGKGFASNESEVIKHEGSDHFPLVARLIF